MLASLQGDMAGGLTQRVEMSGWPARKEKAKVRIEWSETSHALVVFDPLRDGVEGERGQDGHRNLSPGCRIDGYRRRGWRLDLDVYGLHAGLRRKHCERR